jgi:hypothetical protein
MAHDTHGSHQTDNKPTTSFQSSFWLVIILAGLFIAAVNFVKIMSKEEAHGSATEQMHNGHSSEGTHHESSKPEDHSTEGAHSEAHNHAH